MCFDNDILLNVPWNVDIYDVEARAVSRGSTWNVKKSVVATLRRNVVFSQSHRLQNVSVL